MSRKKRSSTSSTDEIVDRAYVLAGVRGSEDFERDLLHLGKGPGRGHEAERPDDPPPDLGAAEPAPPRRPRRPPQAAAVPLDLDPEFVSHPARMQYALLLALLMRSNGTAKFSAKDMDLDDAEFNILFARTIDGKHLEVTVVSAQSGIIRSPEKEAPQWQHNQALGGGALAGYEPVPSPNNMLRVNDQALAEYKAQQEKAQWDAYQQQQQADRSTESGLAASTPPVIVFPDQNQTTSTASPYQFPFQVGSSPTSAVPIHDLNSLQARLLSQDQQLANEQAEAIALMERG